MSEESDYALWVKLANDPSQSEEARRLYRAQMEGYVHKKMREAFQFAARRRATDASPAGASPADEGSATPTPG
jgi:hypothetical protein